MLDFIRKFALYMCIPSFFLMGISGANGHTEAAPAHTQTAIHSIR